MKKILVLKHQKQEDAESPEFSYLLSSCILQAKRLFETHSIIFEEPTNKLEIPDSDYVLILGKENIFFSFESLKRMCNAVNDQIGIALPSLISQFPEVKKRYRYTLRDFETAENNIFKEQQKPKELNASHLPISFFTNDCFQKLISEFSLEEIFNNKDVLKTGKLSTEISQTGVYDQFIDYYAEPRTDILQYIPKNAQDILEIGCGRGITGKLMEERFGCRVTGVELNPLAAEDAKNNISRVIVGNIQELDLEDKYDTVVATELFEHLNYPEDFLDRMKNVLNPGGSIILSTPNVGHYSIVEDLLAGRWDYVPIGLLCYTHFRFFTYQTLKDYIERVGFSSYEIIPQKTELPRRFRLLKYINSNDVDIESLSTKGFYVILTI